ncbi:hypothetical protein KCP69_12585 [Salmonella enterica subsp. enterica]|nr:hypothetical protein KCP69_12585 [Salmonella enterica subsp. enterica]
MMAADAQCRPPLTIPGGRRYAVITAEPHNPEYNKLLRAIRARCLRSRSRPTRWSTGLAALAGVGKHQYSLRHATPKRTFNKARTQAPNLLQRYSGMIKAVRAPGAVMGRGSAAIVAAFALYPKQFLCLKGRSHHAATTICRLNGVSA